MQKIKIGHRANFRAKYKCFQQILFPVRAILRSINFRCTDFNTDSADACILVMACVYGVCTLRARVHLKTLSSLLKDVRAHCYCASLVRTLFIGHARATSFSSARTESKTQQNKELMTFALTWCANIFVGSSVTPTFFSADHFLF